MSKSYVKIKNMSQWICYVFAQWKAESQWNALFAIQLCTHNLWWTLSKLDETVSTIPLISLSPLAQRTACIKYLPAEKMSKNYTCINHNLFTLTSLTYFCIKGDIWGTVKAWLCRHKIGKALARGFFSWIAPWHCPQQTVNLDQPCRFLFLQIVNSLISCILIKNKTHVICRLCKCQNEFSMYWMLFLLINNVNHSLSQQQIPAARPQLGLRGQQRCTEQQPVGSDMREQQCPLQPRTWMGPHQLYQLFRPISIHPMSQRQLQNPLDFLWTPLHPQTHISALVVSETIFIYDFHGRKKQKSLYNNNKSHFNVTWQNKFHISLNSKLRHATNT